ncbi:MAG: glycosyltransferase [Wenzhouxiangella sp.]|nr:MAG: glycosyltransferase [Wenzhouxiangella sp.]
MRIAFINPQGNFDRLDSYLTEHPDFGGQLVYVKELALALARRGVDVDILTRRIDDPQWPGFSDPLDDFGELTERVRIVRLSFGGDGFLAKERLWPHLPAFVEAIEEFYAQSGLPDYFTAHYADAAAVAVQLRQRTGKGFTLTGHSLGAQKMDKLGVSAANFEVMEARYRFSRRLAAEREGMTWADTVITSTSEERFEQYGHALYAGAVDTSDDARFRVIPPGINSRIFNQDPGSDEAEDLSRVEAQVPFPDQPHVVVSSRLDPKKNVAGVVEAFAGSQGLRDSARLALFVRGTDDPWQDLGRLGSEEREVLEPILARIEETGLRERVHFLNLGSQRQLACAYRLLARSGSVFALPSLFEPFGLAPIEAAACGLAVAATRNGGPAEIFADGVGELFDPEDAADMAAALQRALADQETLARRASRRVAERYTWDRTAERYLEVIEANLEQARSIGTQARQVNANLDSLLADYLGQA